MNIYAGNLSRDLSETELREAFEAFGEVSSVAIIKDKFTGENEARPRRENNRGGGGGGGGGGRRY